MSNLRRDDDVTLRVDWPAVAMWAFVALVVALNTWFSIVAFTTQEPK